MPHSAEISLVEKALASNRDDPTSQFNALLQAWTCVMWLNRAHDISWLGFEMKQLPFDLMVLQEIIFAQRPEVIVETGTYKGGSAVFFASVMAMLRKHRGCVISVDVRQRLKTSWKIRKLLGQKFSERITFLSGDSKSLKTFAAVKELIGNKKNIMVVLDSDHSYKTVKVELDLYSQLVPVGGYLVVADTICQALSTLPDPRLEIWKSNNPLTAVDEFISEQPDFIRDETYNKAAFSYCAGGFLRRVKSKRKL